MNSRPVLFPHSGGFNRVRFLGLFVLLLAAAAARSNADIITWTDADSLSGLNDSSWSDPDNWSTGSTPQSTDTAVFNTGISNPEDGVDGDANVVFIDSANLTVGNIFFDTNAFLTSTNGTEQGYDIGGQNQVPEGSSYALTLASSGTIGILSTFLGAGVTQTVSASLLLGGNATFSSNSAGNTLALSGSIGAPGVAGPEIITLSGVGLGLISGTIGTSGTISVLMMGPGTWTLSGDNVYTGTTEIDGGTLNVATLANVNTGSSIGIGSSGGSAADLLFGGGILQYTGATAQSTNRLFTLGDASGLTATIDASGAPSLATVTFNSASALGVYSTTSALTLTLTGSNSGANTFAPVIGNSGSGGVVSLVKSGTGTWDITATTSSYTGTTEIDGGILNVKSLANESAGSSIGAGAGPGSTTDLVFGGGALQYTGATAQSTNRLFTIGDANGSAATIDSSSSTAGATVTFNSPSGLGTYSTGTLTLNLVGSNTGNNTFDPGIGDGAGGITSLVKSGAGVWVLGGTNTYSGSTTINAGILKISAAGNLGGGASTNTITLNGGTLESTANLYSLSSNQAITLAAASSIQVDSGTLTLPQNITNGGNLLTVSDSGNVIISGNVSGGGGITKSGTGTLTLGGNNSYTGALTLGGGVTNVTTAGVNGTSAANSLIFNTGTFQANSGGSVTVSGTVAMNGVGTIDTDGQTVTLSGLVYGGGALTKIGAGTLVFSNPNTIGTTYPTFSGGLTISNGTVQQGSATDAWALGSGNIIFGTSNTPAVDLDGNNLTTGLLSGSNDAVVTNSVASTTGTLTLAGAGSQAFAGVIQNGVGGGTTALTVLSGNQTLSGTNTYTGNTTINGGSLILDTGTNTAGNILNSSSALVMNGGILQLISRTGANSQGMNGLTLDGGGIVTINNLGTSGSISLGTITRVQGGVVDFQSTQGSAALGLGSIINTTNVNDNSGILGAWATTGSGSALAAVNASGNIVPYTGYTSLSLGGAISTGVNTNVRINGGSSGNITVGTGTTSIETLTQAFSTAATVAITAGQFLQTGTVGGIFITPGSAALTIGATVGTGTITAGGNSTGVNGELILDNNSSNVLTINSVIANNGTGVVGLTKSGTGTVNLTAANTYTGALVISGGLLESTDDLNLASASSITINGGALEPTAVSNESSHPLAPNITIGPAGAVLSDTQTMFLNSKLLGNGTLTLNSLVGSVTTELLNTAQNTSGATFTGPIILAGANNVGLYANTASLPNDLTNGITFNGSGTPVLGSANGALVTSKSITFTSSGEVNPTGGLITLNGPISGGGAITDGQGGITSSYGSGGGWLTITNPANNFTGTISIDGVLNATTASLASTIGTMTFGGNNPAHFSVLQAGIGGLTTGKSIADNVSGGSTGYFDSNGSSMTLSGIIGGSGPLGKLGGGTVTLNGAGTNSWNGASLTIADGTLLLDFSNQATPTNLLNSGAALTLGNAGTTAGGTLALTSGGTLSINGKPGSVATAQAFGNPTFAADTVNGIALTPNGGPGVTLTLGNIWTENPGASLLITLPSGATLASNPTLTGGILGYALVAAASGTGFATVSGNQIVPYNDESLATMLNGANGDNGGTNFTTYNSTYTSGTLAVAMSSGTAAMNALVVDTTNGGGTLSLGGAGNTLYLTTGALLFRGGSNEIITGGQIGAAGTSPLIVHQIGSGTLTINSPIGTYLASGLSLYNASEVIDSASVTKDGAGTLIISGSQTYSGPTMVDQGTLQLAGSSFGIGTIYIDQTGIVQMGSATGLSLYNNVIFDTGSTGRFQLNGFNTTVASINTPADESTNGIIENASATPATLTLAGGGTQGTYMPAANTTTFGFLIQDGAGGGSLGLTLANGTILTLVNADTYTGATTIDGGTLTVGGVVATGTAIGGSLNGTAGTALAFNGSGTFNVNEASGVSQGMGVLTLGGGDAVIQSTNNGGASDLNFASLGTIGPAATGNFVLSGGVNGSTNEITFTASPGTAGTLLGPGLFFSGSSYATYNASNYVSAYAYGGASDQIINSSAATFGTVVAASNVLMNAPVTAQTSGTINTLDIAGNFNVTLTGTATVGVTGILDAGGSVSTSSTISGGVALFPSSGNNLFVRTNASTDTLTINTPIVVDGLDGLVKSGAGTLVLGGANTYAGPTVIDGGTLKFSAASALGNAAATNTITLANGTVLYSTAGNNTLAANQAITLTGPAMIRADGATLTINGNINNGGSLLNFYTTNTGGQGLITINGIISGSGGVVYNQGGGGATFTANGANTYSGPTYIGAAGGNATATLDISAADNLGNGSLTNTIVFGNADTLISTGGTYDLGVNRSILLNSGGGIQSNAGTLTVSGNVETEGNTLTLSGAGNIVLSGNFGNFLAPNTNALLTKSGAGTAYVTGNNTGWTSSDLSQINMSGGTLNVNTASINGASSGGGIQWAGTSTLQAGPGGIVTAKALGITSNSITATFDTNGYNSTLAGQFTGAQPLSNFRVIGSGTLTMDPSTADTTTAGLQAMAGTLTLSYANLATPTNLWSSSAALTMGGGVLDILAKTGGSATAQTFASLTLSANTYSDIMLTPNGGTGVTLTLGNTWTQGQGSSLLINLSAAGTSAVTSTPSTLTNGIVPNTLVEDSGGIGFATVSGGNVVRYDDTTGTTFSIANATNLTGATNFTTLNSPYTSGTLSGGPFTGSVAVNSLAIDTTNNGGTINLGASTDVLTLTTDDILFRGGNNEVITGGQIGAAGTVPLIVDQLSTTGTLTISSPIGSSFASGLSLYNAAGLINSASVALDGGGTLILSGSQTYSGLTLINQGTLQFASSAFGISTVDIGLSGIAQMGSSTGLGLYNNIVFTTGTGRFQLNGFNTTIGSISDTASNPTAQVIENASATPATLTLGGAGTQIFAGVIQDGAGGGSLGLTIAGGGSLTLTNADTYTGTTTIAGGTLTIGALATTGTAAGLVSSITGNLVAGGTPLTFNGSGTFDVNEAGGVSQGMGALMINAGDATIQSTNNGGASILNFASLGALGSGATANFVLSGGVNGSTNEITFTAAPGTAGAFLGPNVFFSGSSYATWNAGGYISAYVYGGNDLVVNSSGATFGSIPSAASNVQMNAPVTAQTSGTINTLDIAGNYNLTLAGGATLGVTGILDAGGSVSTSSTISGGTAIYPTAGGNLIVRTNASTDTLTINTPIVVDGLDGLVKSGSGTLVLGGVNTYAGPTIIDGGILEISAANQLGNGWETNTITLANGASLQSIANSYALAANQSITLTGAASIQDDANNTTVTINGNVNNGGNTLTLSGGSAATASTATLFMNGVISGSGGLTLIATQPNGSRPGTFFTLNGANTYSGVTSFLTAGTGRGETLISAADNLGDGSITNTIYINGPYELESGNGTYDLGVNRSIYEAGGPTIYSNAGTLTISGNMELSNGNISLGGAGNEIISGDISNSTNSSSVSSVIKLGTGTVYLTGNNSQYFARAMRSLTNANQFQINGGILNATDAGLDAGEAVDSDEIGFNGGVAGSTLQAGPGGINTSKIITIWGGAVETAVFDSNGSNSTFSGPIEDANSSNPSAGSYFIKTGIGTLTLNSSTPATSGSTSGFTPQVGLAADAGTLILDFSNFAGNAPTNMWLWNQPLTIGGGTLDINGKGGGSVVTSQTFTTLTVNAGPGAIVLTDTGSGSGNTVTLAISTAGAFTRTAAGTLNFVIPTGASMAWAPTLTNGIIGPWATTIVDGGQMAYATATSGTVAAYVSGSSVSTAAGVTDTTGTGNWNVGMGQTAGNGGGALGGTSFNTLLYAGAGDTITGNFAANGLMNAGSGTLVMSGNVNIGANNELVITGSSGITLSGAIANDGATASALTYAGSGVLTLGGVNTYSGVTTISGPVQFSGNQMIDGGITIDAGGVAVLGSASGLGVGNTVTFGPASSGTLVLNGNNLTLGAALGTYSASNSFSLLGSPVIENASGSPVTSSTLSIGVTGNSTFAGVIQDGAGGGTLSLNKIGLTTLILTGTNTFTGGTTVTQGALQLGDDFVNSGSLAGNIVLNSPYYQPLLFENPANSTFAGVISGAAAGGVTKNSTGTEFLTNSNTYTGLLQLYNGTINASTAGINGTDTTNGIFFNSTGINSTELNGLVVTITTYPATLQAAASGINTAKAVYMYGNGTFDTNGNNSVLSGPFSGGGTLTKIGNGTLTLSGDNGAFIGGLAVTQGLVQDSNATALQYAAVTLNLANGLTFNSGIGTFNIGGLAGNFNQSLLDNGSNPINLTLWGNGSQSYFGALSGAGASLTKVGSGTQTLFGADTYTGPTTVNGGTLVADTGEGNTVLSPLSTLMLGSGAFQLNGQLGANESQVLNGLTLIGGAGIVNANAIGFSNGATTTIDLSGTSGTLGITRNAGATVDFQAASGAVGTTAIVKTGQANDVTGILGAWATVNNGANLAANNGSNVIVAYTGYAPLAALGSTIANDSTNNVQINSAGAGSNIALASGTTNINTLMQASTTAATVADTGDLNVGAGTAGGVGSILIAPGDAALTIGASAGTGVLTAGGAGVSGELILDNNAASTLTINSVIANNINDGIVSVTKSGTGTALLAATNTFSGPVAVDAGTLQVNLQSGLMYTGLGMAFNGQNFTQSFAGSANIITLNGGALSTVAALGGRLAQAVIVGPAGGTINVTTNALTMDGLLSGSGALSISQSASLYLDNPNDTFTGVINFAAVSSNAILFANTATLGGNTTNPIDFNASGSRLAALPGGLVTNRTLYINNTSNLDSFYGPLVLDGPMMGGGALSIITGDYYGGVYLNGNGEGYTGTLTVGGLAIVNTLSISSNSGQINMQGILQAGPGGFVNSRNIDMVNGGIGWFDTNGTTMTLGGSFTNNTGAIVKIGAGTLDLTGTTNSWSGASLTVNGGTLLLDYTLLATPVNRFAGTTTVIPTLGGGNLAIEGKPGSVATAQTLGSPTLTGISNSAITLIPNGGLSTTLTLGNTWTRGAGSSLLIDLSSQGTAILGSSPTLTNGILPYALVLDGSGEGFATVVGGDVVRYNDATGTAFATANASSLSGGTNYTTLNTVYSTGTLAFASGTNISVNSLTVDTTTNGGTIDLGTPTDVLTLTGGAVLFRGPNPETIQDGQLGANGSEVMIHQLGGGLFTVATTITSGTAGSAGSLTVDGTGVTLLSASNTYTGATTVNGGTLRAGLASVAGVSGTSGPFGVNSLVTLANNPTAVLDLNSFNVSIGALNGGGAGFDPTVFDSGNISQAVVNAGAGGGGLSSSVLLGSGTLTVGSLNSNTDYAGTISGAGGGLTKIGTGTLRLTGSNTYTGVTSLNGGIVSISFLANGSQPSPLGESTNAAGNLIFNGGQLLYTGTANASTDRSFTITSGSTATIMVANYGTSLTLSGTSTATSGNLTIGVSSNDTTTPYFGTVVLAGLNNYTGVTTIAGLTSNGNAGHNNLYGGGTTLSVSTLANGGQPSNIGASSNAQGNLVLFNGNLQYTGATVTTDRGFTVTAGSALNGITVTNAGTNLTFTGGAAGGTGQLDKYGPGALTLGGATANYAIANVDVAAGTLLVNGTLSGTVGDASATTLGGAGIITGNVQVFGTLAPGGLSNASTGILTTGTGVHDNGQFVQLLAGSTLAIQLNGTAAGSGYDQLAITGTSAAGVGLSLSAGDNLALSIGSGFVPTSGLQYTIALLSATSSTAYANAFASLNGVATNLAQNAIFTTSSDTFQISYRANGSTFDIGAGSGSIMLMDMGTYYWSDGATGGSWSNASNFTLDSGGTTPAPVVPFAPINVVFSTGTATTPLTTTLDGSYTFNSLTFGAGAALSNPVTINPGSSGTNTVTINAGAFNGSTAGNGITVNSGAAPDTINANVALGGSQSWTNNSANTLTVNGVVSGAGNGLTIAGSGEVALTGANTYSGPTTVSSGATLLVSGSISGSTVVVANGGTLISGSNTTAQLGNGSNPVSVYGTLDVGGTANSVGELATGPLTLGTTGTMATLAMELGGTATGAYDQIQVTPGSALNLADVTLQASLINGYTPQPGDLLFLIVGAGSETGSFADAVGNSITIGSQQFNVSYDASASGDSFTGGDDVALQAVPEPGTWANLLGGLGLLILFRRFRRSRRNAQAMR